MKGLLLKLYLLSSLALLSSLNVHAQNFRFIYIQTENQKPFYVKMGEESIPSSPSGYIIIPKLTAGAYKIAIGFPQSTLPELLVTVVLYETDAGFLLKNDIDQGLYIVDLQTKRFISTEREWPEIKNWQMIKSEDEFARILSEVVNDSTIGQIKVFKKPSQTTVKSAVSKTFNPSTALQPEAVIIIDNKTAISKLGQNITDEGLWISYIDNADTIRLLIPANEIQKLNAKEEKSEPLIVAKKEGDGSKDVKFINMELQNPNQQADSGAIKKDDFVITQKKNVTATAAADVKQQNSITELKTPPAQANSNCKKTATQNNFLNLRKKMAAEKTEAAMRTLAAKQFSIACFTTAQIKNLGVLFITEEERYKFYVSAYSYVSDSENYATLSNQLADSYYINRFKAMLQH